MIEFQIEVDVDGVLADMDGGYTPYIIDIIPDYTEEKYITGWSMPIVAENYPEAFERVKKLWVDPEYIANLPRYERVTEGMSKLGKFCKNKAKILVHTHLLEDGAVYSSRYNWLKDLQRESKTDFDINISVGPVKKVFDNIKVKIEDCVSNLQKSNADYKFLVRRCHNRDFNESDLGECKGAFVVDSFYDAVQIIEDIDELKGGECN